MPGGRRLDQLQSEAVLGALDHVECLSEAQIAKDIHSQVVAPIGHVPGLSPALGVAAAIRHADLLAEGAHVAQDVALHLLHGALGEGVRQDTALAGVDILVAGVVGVGGRVDEGVVELGLADVGAEAVDLLEGRVGVEGNGVGAEAHDRAFFGSIVNRLTGS